MPISVVALRAITSDSDWSGAACSLAGVDDGDGASSAARCWQPAATNASAAATTACGFHVLIGLLPGKTAPASACGEAGASSYLVGRRVQFPTIEAPRKLSTWPIGFAIADCELPANSRPTARAWVETSSTISEPESPLFKNREPRLRITIWPVNVFVNAEPPAHSFS